MEEVHANVALHWNELTLRPIDSVQLEFNTMGIVAALGGFEHLTIEIRRRQHRD